MKLVRLFDKHDGDRLEVVTAIKTGGDYRKCIVYGVDFENRTIDNARIGPTIFLFCDLSRATFINSKQDPEEPIVFSGTKVAKTGMKTSGDRIDFLKQ